MRGGRRRPFTGGGTRMGKVAGRNKVEERWGQRLSSREREGKGAFPGRNDKKRGMTCRMEVGGGQVGLGS